MLATVIQSHSSRFANPEFINATLSKLGKLKYLLEIGSWEGHSAIFLLSRPCKEPER